jgi:hypothetical protein
MGPFVRVGLDLAKRADHTALIVAMEKKATVERERIEPGTGYRVTWKEDSGPSTFTVRHIQRFERGISYPDQVEQIADTVAGLHKRRQEGVIGFEGAPHIHADVTGVGGPICDLLRKRLKERAIPALLVEVTFVHGERLTTRGPGQLSVGKFFLVSQLNALLATERLLLPDTPEAKLVTAELKAFQVKVSTAGVDTYEAMHGAHDDLVCALALACLKETTPNTIRRNPNRRQIHGYA